MKALGVISLALVIGTYFGCSKGGGKTTLQITKPPHFNNNSLPVADTFRFPKDVIYQLNGTWVLYGINEKDSNGPSSGGPPPVYNEINPVVDTLSVTVIDSEHIQIHDNLYCPVGSSILQYLFCDTSLHRLEFFVYYYSGPYFTTISFHYGTTISVDTFCFGYGEGSDWNETIVHP